MNIRTKKLVGTIATVVFLIVYTLVASRVGMTLLPPEHGLAQLAFYAVAGLAWIVPVGALIVWMQRDGRPRS